MSKDRTASEWAEWAAGFCGFTTYVSEFLKGKEFWQWEGGDTGKADFNPLNDLNHLGLIKAEVLRRGYSIRVGMLPDYSSCELEKDGAETLFGDGATENEAILDAAKALEEAYDD